MGRLSATVRRRLLLVGATLTAMPASGATQAPPTVSPSDTIARPPASAPYRDPTRSADERAQDLLARMSLEEKFWRLFMIPGDRDDPTHDYRAGSFGLQISVPLAMRANASRSDTLPASTVARAHTERINAVQRWFVQDTRLGIPLLPFEETLHGLTREGATTFPQAIALAATWDTALVSRVAAAIARETRSRGIRMSLSPVINVANDERWGRVEETYGEDTWLTGAMGRAYITPLERAGIIATPKHLIANVGDGGRDSYPIEFSTRLLEHDVLASVARPVIELAGFTRVMLAPGRSQTVQCLVSRAQLSLLDATLQRVVEPGMWRVLVGASSKDIRLRADRQHCAISLHRPVFLRVLLMRHLSRALVLVAVVASSGCDLLSPSTSPEDLLWEVPGELTTQPLATETLLIAAFIDGTVKAYDRKTGKLVWERNLRAELRADRLVRYRDVVVVSTIELVGLDIRTGVERWRFSGAQQQAGALNPQLSGDTLFVPGFVGGEASAINANTGIPYWRVTLGEVVREPTVGADLVIFATRSASAARATLVALDRSTGIERWRRPMPSEFSSPGGASTAGVIVGNPLGGGRERSISSIGRPPRSLQSRQRCARVDGWDGSVAGECRTAIVPAVSLPGRW